MPVNDESRLQAQWHQQLETQAQALATQLPGILPAVIWQERFTKAYHGDFTRWLQALQSLPKICDAILKAGAEIQLNGSLTQTERRTQSNHSGARHYRASQARRPTGDFGKRYPVGHA